MNLRSRVLAAFALAVMTVGWSFETPERRPSTPEDRATAVRLVRELELDPLSKDSKEKRTWLTGWLVAVPDVNVTLCTEFFPELQGSSANHAPELAVQSAFSMAAFIIENPEMAKDSYARYLAGVEGTLRAYES